MLYIVQDTLCRFCEDKRGSAAPLFAAAIVAVILCSSIAIDGIRLYHSKTRIRNAIDAAALAGARAARLQRFSLHQARDIAHKIFAQNYQGSSAGSPAQGRFAEIKAVDVTIDLANGAAIATVSVDAVMRTMFGGIAGLSNIQFASSGSAIFEARDTELALQLDVTHSMKGAKLEALKVAAGTLIDIVIPERRHGGDVRIGLVPFSAGVNAGRYAKLVSGNDRGQDTCVYERRIARYQALDVAPGTHNTGLMRRDDFANPKDVKKCPEAEILPLTDDRNLLKDTIAGYAAAGRTAGHLGTAWAWYLLSPNWSSIWPAPSRPAPYEQRDVQKIAILMTDGKYNTLGGKSDTHARSGTFALAACEAMLAQGITVYTIVFQADGATGAEDMMQRCASDPGKAYLAKDGVQLRAAFRDIAERILTLRLSS